MKKVYSKPNLLIEDFSLVENISSGGCYFEIHTHTKEFCHYDASNDVSEEDKIVMGDTIDFSNVFYKEGICNTVLGGNHEINCLNGIWNVFSS